MCDVHFERAALKTNEKKDEREIAYKIMTAIEDETKRQELSLEPFDRKYSKAMDTIDFDEFWLFSV